MAKFLVLARDPVPYPDMSPDEIQRVIQKYRAWSDGLRRAGRLLDSHKLRDEEGRVVRRSGGQLMVTDGPYIESKEVLGGYWVIQAAGYDEAVRLLSDSPHLEFGTFEVREIEEPPPLE